MALAPGSSGYGATSIGLTALIFVLIIVLIVVLIKKIAGGESKHGTAGYFAIAGAILSIAVFTPMPWWLLGVVAGVILVSWVGGIAYKKHEKREEEKKAVEEPETKKYERQSRRAEKELEDAKAKGAEKELIEELQKEVELNKHLLATTAAMDNAAEAIQAFTDEETKTEEIIERIEKYIKKAIDELGKIDNLSTLDKAGKEHVSKLLERMIDLHGELVEHKEEKAEAVDAVVNKIKDDIDVIRSASEYALGVARGVKSEIEDINKTLVKGVKKKVKELKEEVESEEAKEGIEKKGDELIELCEGFEEPAKRKGDAQGQITKALKKWDKLVDDINDAGGELDDYADDYKDGVEDAKAEQEKQEKEFDALVKRHGPGVLAKYSIRHIGKFYKKLIAANKALLKLEGNIQVIIKNSATIMKKEANLYRAEFFQGKLDSEFIEFFRKFETLSGEFVKSVTGAEGEYDTDAVESFADRANGIATTMTKVFKYERKRVVPDVKEDIEKASEKTEEAIDGLKDEHDDLVQLQNYVIKSLEKIAKQVVKQKAKADKEFEKKAGDIMGDLKDARKAAKKQYKYSKKAKKAKA